MWWWPSWWRASSGPWPDWSCLSATGTGRAPSPSAPVCVSEASSSCWPPSLMRVLRFLTAGESHGQALVVIVEGLPAGLAVTVDDIQAELARRRLGYGRGPRMRFEQDAVTLLGGVRHGR